MSSWNPFGWFFKKSKEDYDELLREFLRIYGNLTRLIREVNEIVKRSDNAQGTFIKLDQLYEVYCALSKVSAKILGINWNWHSIDGNISYFYKGLNLLFKYRDNFDHKKAVDTLKVMNNSLERIDNSLRKLNAESKNFK